MTVYTSRSFACMRRLFDLYDNASLWPAHPTTGIVPSVYFGGIDGQDIPQESVIILGSPPSAPQIDWVTLGATAQDETFVLRVQIDTVVESMAQNDQRIDLVVFNRLWALADVAQQQFRDQTTGQPAGGFGRNDGHDCRAWQWRVQSPQPHFFLTDIGVAGSVDIDIAFICRI